MAENLTYQSVSPEPLDTNLVVAPVPQLQPLTDFITNPRGYVESKPTLQIQYKNPSVEISNAQNDLGNWLKGIERNVSNLAYNKYDTKPIEYDNRLAQLYKDPELGFIPGRDNDSYYDANQTALGDFARNTLGFTTNFAGSALQTLAGTPSAIAATVNWLTNGFDSESFSKVYDNPISRSISDWMDRMQEQTNNFRNANEREIERNPLLNLIPFYGNGFGDAMRSLGYGAGAAGGIFLEEALVTALTGGTGTVPLLASQLGRFIKVGSKAENALQATASLANIERIAQGTYATGRIAGLVDEGINGALGARNILSSLSEASFEALETQKNLELKMIQDYRDKNGFDPTTDELRQIHQATLNAGNARYVLNVALLSLSNAVAFDGLFKNFPMARYFGNESSRAAIELGEQGFQRASRAVLENAQPWYKAISSKAPKFIGSSIGRGAPEAFEEGAQNVFDIGTGYYAQNKFEGKDELSSILDSSQRALKETVTTSEGWNAMLQGFVAGDVQGRAVNVLSRKSQQNLDRIREAQTDFILGSTNALFKDASGNFDVTKAANLFNIQSIGGSVQSKINGTASAVGAQKAARKAVEANDQQTFQTKKDDLQFQFLSSFIQNNQFEALEDVLDSWSKLAANDVEAFKKQFGLQAPTVSKSTVEDSLRKLRTKAEFLKDRYDEINLTYSNSFPVGTPEYETYNGYKQELVAQLFKYERFKERYQELAASPVSENFNHLQTAFKSDELRSALQDIRAELKVTDELDELGGGSDFGISDLKQVKRQDKQRKKSLEKLEGMLDSPLTEEKAQEFMLLADELLGNSELRERSNINQILNNISDMVALQRNQEATLDLYRKLTSKEGLDTFKQAEATFQAQADENTSKAEREAQKAEAQRIKEEETVQRRQQTQANYGEQLEELSQATEIPVEELQSELVESGVELTPENVDEFVLSKIPVAEGGTLEVDPRESYRADPSTLRGKFIRYESGSENGTKGYRYVENVGDTDQRGTSLDTVDFNEDGTYKGRGSAKRYKLESAKFAEVKDASELSDLFTQVTERLTPKAPEIPTQTPLRVMEKKPTTHFLQFFTGTGEDGLNRASRILSTTSLKPKFAIANYKARKPSSLQRFIDREQKTFENENYLVNSDASPNSFSVQIQNENGENLGIFLPLSSYYLLDKNKKGEVDPRESFYDLMDDVYQRKSKAAQEKLEAVTSGSIQDLLVPYHLETIFRKNGIGEISPESINKNLAALGLNPIQFKPYFMGTNSPVNTQEENFPLLKDMVLDRNNSFVYVDNEGAKFFEGSSVTSSDVEDMLSKRANMFEAGRSRLSSYTLVTKDSSGKWSMLPVRTIPVTTQPERMVQVEDTIKAAAMEQFANMQPAEIMQFLNNQFFYQDTQVKSHFNVSSNGRLEFYTSSLFKQPIAGKGRGKNDEQKITTYLDAEGINYDFTQFTFDSFFEAIAKDVDSKSKGAPDGGKVVNLTKAGFRFKERFGKNTADEFGEMRVIAESTLPFRTINVSYTLASKPAKVTTVPVIDLRGKVSEQAPKDVVAIQEVRIKRDVQNTAPIFYLSAPNKKGSFLGKEDRFDVATVGYDVRNAAYSDPNNFETFEVSISSDPTVQKALGRSLDSFILPVFDLVETTNKPDQFETIEPAIYRQEGNQFLLVKKGKVRASNKITSPSLKMEASQVDFLVQKALRDC